MIASSIRFMGLAALVLLATACATAAGSASQPSAPSTGAPPASTAKPSEKPSWPDNGIAQRKFLGNVLVGGTMFVENDHGTRHAWVLTYPTKTIDDEHVWAEALDFFSGKIMQVKVELTDDGHEDQAFTAPDGRYHFYTADPRFRFSGTDMMRSLAGLDFNGDAINVASAIIGCALHLDAATAAKNWDTGVEPAMAWQKFPVYHEDTGSKGCSSGFLHSMIGSALDLGDGTFLAAEGCFVFRLRKSDLSPVGSAPALRVVDESTVKVALAKLHGRKINDPTGYMIKALNMPADPDVSCKED